MVVVINKNLMGVSKLKRQACLSEPAIFLKFSAEIGPVPRRIRKKLPQSIVSEFPPKKDFIEAKYFRYQIVCENQNLLVKVKWVGLRDAYKTKFCSSWR